MRSSLYLSELPETDLDGREFTVISHNTIERLNFHTEDLTGDVFNDSLRERDLRVEERLKVKISNIPTANSNETTAEHGRSGCPRRSAR